MQDLLHKTFWRLNLVASELRSRADFHLAQAERRKDADWRTAHLRRANYWNVQADYLSQLYLELTGQSNGQQP